MHPDDALPPDPVAQRVAELEAENARLRQELAEAERRGMRLQGELQHRVRNALAVVRSITRRTAQTSETPEDYAMHLGGRLDAIARVQAALAHASAGGVPLDGLLAEELLAHRAHEDDGVSLRGPEVRVWGKAAELLALAMHELAVNAVKYGALSAPRGRIAVTWQIEPDDARPEDAGSERAGPKLSGQGQAGRVLRLEWQETGVPLPDVPSRRKGFGTEVIERTLAYELGATGSLGFGPDGARCTVALPVTELIAAADPRP